MKKSIVLGAALLWLAACKKEAPATEQPAAVDTVAVPPPSAVETPDTSAVDSSGAGTSVKIGPEGVSVDTKNKSGATKIEVKDPAARQGGN